MTLLDACLAVRSRGGYWRGSVQSAGSRETSRKTEREGRASAPRGRPRLRDGVRANTADDCRPLLFWYDALVDIDVHLRRDAEMQVEVIDKGHFGGQQAIPERRSPIRRATGL